jgi:hypothetical protein
MKRTMEIMIEMDVENDRNIDEGARRSLKGKMKREFEKMMLSRETIERQKREIQQHPSGEMAALAVHGEDDTYEEFKLVKKPRKTPAERIKEKKAKRKASPFARKRTPAQQAAFEKFQKKGSEAQR